MKLKLCYTFTVSILNAFYKFILYLFLLLFHTIQYFFISSLKIFGNIFFNLYNLIWEKIYATLKLMAFIGQIPINSYFPKRFVCEICWFGDMRKTLDFRLQVLNKPPTSNVTYKGRGWELAKLQNFVVNIFVRLTFSYPNNVPKEEITEFLLEIFIYFLIIVLSTLDINYEYEYLETL